MVVIEHTGSMDPLAQRCLTLPKRLQRQEEQEANRAEMARIEAILAGDLAVSQDVEDTEEEDMVAVDIMPRNIHTSPSQLPQAPYRLHQDLRNSNPHNNHRTSHTPTPPSTSTTTTCAATVDMMCPVGTQVPHAQTKRTTLNITMQLIVTMLSSTGPRDGGSAKKQCTKSPFHQIRAPTRHDG